MIANLFFHDVFPKSYGFVLSRSIYTIAKLGVPDLFDKAPLRGKEIAQKRNIANLENLERLMNFLVSQGIFAKSDGGYCHTDLSRELKWERSGKKIVQFHDLRWEALADERGLQKLEEEDKAETRIESMSRLFVQARAIYLACRLQVFEKLDQHQEVPNALRRHLEQAGLMGEKGLTQRGRLFLDEKCRAFILHDDEARWRSFGELDEAIKDGIIPFEKLTGSDFFHYLKARPKAMKIFSDAMVFISEFECSNLVPGLKNILKSGMRVMDVGGGTGRYLKEILAAYPEVEGILFDLPENVEAASKGERCQVVGGDFFEWVPEADVYLFKRVLHDWSDQDCVRILQKCSASAKSGSRLVLNEFLLPQPEALMIDTFFISAFKGRQRTIEEIVKILEEGGWKMESCEKTGCWLGQIVAVKNLGI